MTVIGGIMSHQVKRLELLKAIKELKKHFRLISHLEKSERWGNKGHMNTGVKFSKMIEKVKRGKMKWVDYDAGEDCYEDEHKGHWEIVK